eukprot:COSAG03_NODE_4315_length_1596_cov_5.979960_1_plen_72_part_10
MCPEARAPEDLAKKAMELQPVDALQMAVLGPLALVFLYALLQIAQIFVFHNVEVPPPAFAAALAVPVALCLL